MKECFPTSISPGLLFGIMAYLAYKKLLNSAILSKIVTFEGMANFILKNWTKRTRERKRGI